MTDLQSILVWIALIGIGVMMVGVCAQGRLKYWILVALGAVPKAGRARLFGDIPRGERDWSMVSRLGTLDRTKGTTRRA